MTDRLRRALAALVALTVVGAGAIGAVAAASNGSLSASPAAPGEASTHTATVTVGDSATGSLNGFALDYTAASGSFDASDVSAEDVTTVGIDRGDDASGTTTDVDVSDDLSGVTVSNNGGTLTVQFGGSYSLNAGDEVVVVVEGVQNADSASEYTVNLDVNPQSSGGETTAGLTLGSMDGGDSTTTAADGDGSDGDGSDGDDGTDNEAGDGGDDGGSSGGSVPGFGAGAALAAVLGAALLALRN
jgi:PGF-CTERM protein